MKITQEIHLANHQIMVNDLEYHEDGDYAGYITAITVLQWKYCRETLFRVYDSRTTADMKLVYIENSHLHPALGRYWHQIEEGFIGICKNLGLSPKGG